jgi:hypothetical protein
MFEVEGVGPVVSGKALQGTIQLGQRVMLGPTSAGGFTEVAVRCIQRAHVPVKQVLAGQTATLALQLAEGAQQGQQQAANGAHAQQGAAGAAAVELLPGQGAAGSSGRVQEAGEVPGRRPLQEQEEQQGQQQQQQQRGSRAKQRQRQQEVDSFGFVGADDAPADALLDLDLDLDLGLVLDADVATAAPADPLDQDLDLDAALADLLAEPQGCGSAGVAAPAGSASSTAPAGGSASTSTGAPCAAEVLPVAQQAGPCSPQRSPAAAADYERSPESPKVWHLAQLRRSRSMHPAPPIDIQPAVRSSGGEHQPL